IQRPRAYCSDVARPGTDSTILAARVGAASSWACRILSKPMAWLWVVRELRPSLRPADYFLRQPPSAIVLSCVGVLAAPPRCPSFQLPTDRLPILATTAF